LTGHANGTYLYKDQDSNYSRTTISKGKQANSGYC
jgi:hypothetical protein